MKGELDKFDVQILEELRLNSRLPHAELATRINLSRNAVRTRIERLEASGLIAGYTIIEGKGLNGADEKLVALVFVYRHDRMRSNDILLFLNKIPEAVSCDVMSGEFDIVLRVEARSTERIRQIWKEVSSMDGVRDTLTSISLRSL
ncbi:Lrp/AsnC family transcriptional regulator [Halomonas nitroreducens]|uniref:Lrp/AsnC family transcriptional regulator n=1 Tax=Halomonas nitroreducens TaxID=447425 RepID=A0A3S0J9L4_9GAMM|nr:Lrp/AsnC family transcriptional regulator [Halomonas nitroreducens]RTR02985.1 Lrp/AsnC family transcriptional regulator [Halomonas nitroreducens]